MISLPTSRPRARFAGVALIAAGVVLSGCGRPSDSAWLRFLGFGDSATATSTTLEGELRDGKALTASANFQNASQNVGQTTGGTGITVYRVHVDYRMSGYSPPAVDYDLSLYLTAPGDGATTTGALTVALASTTLKKWLIDTGGFEDTTSKPQVELTADATFYGKADDGTEIEAEGSISITLSNSGATSNTTNSTVTVAATADAFIDGVDGEFTVYRSGGTTAELEVEFALSGSAVEDTDYEGIEKTVLIPAGSKSATITIIAKSGATSGRKIILSLVAGETYTVGTPSSATMKITGQTLQSVSVAWTANASKSGADGQFTVTRSGGSSAAELTVEFTVSGDATSGTDYVDFGTSVLLPADSETTTISVVALTGGTTGRKVIVTLSSSTSYKLGSPTSASLKITD